MATIKQRLRRYNGTDYDSVYLSANVGDSVGVLPVANGGTGRSTLTSGYFLRGNGTSAITMSTAAASRNAMGLGNTTGALPVANGGTGNTSVDTTPTSGSNKMCTSDGIYNYVNNKMASVGWTTFATASNLQLFSNQYTYIAASNALSIGAASDAVSLYKLSASLEICINYILTNTSSSSAGASAWLTPSSSGTPSSNSIRLTGISTARQSSIGGNVLYSNRHCSINYDMIYTSINAFGLYASGTASSDMLDVTANATHLYLCLYPGMYDTITINQFIVLYRWFLPL